MCSIDQNWGSVRYSKHMGLRNSRLSVVKLCNSMEGTFRDNDHNVAYNSHSLVPLGGNY